MTSLRIVAPRLTAANQTIQNGGKARIIGTSSLFTMVQIIACRYRGRFLLTGPVAYSDFKGYSGYGNRR